MSELQKHTFKYVGEEYVKIQIATLKSPDKYGRTHTSYVSIKESES